VSFYYYYYYYYYWGQVSPSTAICPFLGLISWNLTTRGLAVTGGGTVVEYGRLNRPSWLLGAL